MVVQRLWQLARELGLGTKEPTALHARELTNAEAQRLAEMARNTDVFARVSPEEKLRIVEALQEAGEVVALEWKDPLGLRGCGFFTVRDGRIVFQRGYWDKLSFLKMHGLPIE